MEKVSAGSPDSLFNIIWRGKWIIIVITGLFAFAGIMYATSLPDKYKASILLAPADSESTGGLSGLTSQLGGIASLAGLSMSGGNANKVGEALALLNSRSFIQSFISKRNLLPELIAIQSWDKESGVLIYDKSKFDMDNQLWVRTPPKNKKVIPTAWEGFNQFISMLKVSDLGNDGTLSISLESQSPVIAKQWLEWLVEDLNSTISERELAEAKQSVIYLRQQIQNTNVSELKSIFYSLIEEQTKKMLLGEVRQDYVLKVVAPPVFPEDRSSPSRALICIAITFVGGIFSVFLVLVMSFLRRGA
jgi:LPS O-antigen subunit length determinant protein (WzzB/FepE family)